MTSRPVLELGGQLGPGRFVLVPEAEAEAYRPFPTLPTMNTGPAVPPWLPVAFGELGVREVKGGENPRIMEYHGTIDPKRSYLDEDEDPWCASFVGWVLRQVGIKGSGLAAARSYEAWGEASPARLGAIAVFHRGNGPRVPWDPKNPTPGHVAILLAETARGVAVLGGNQGDGVTVSTFARADLIGYRWPTSWGTP